MSLAEKLPRHDARVLSALVALAIKHRAAPDWPAAWNRLTDIGRHVLLQAAPADVFAVALDCWAAAPAGALERGARRFTLGTLRKQHEAEAVREIERQQLKFKGARAQEAVA